VAQWQDSLANAVDSAKDPTSDIMDRPLIFIHIPKTAGATLRAILTQRFPKEETFSCGASTLYTEFYTMPPEQRARLRLLAGHMPFGLHAGLPSPANYVTILRNPVDRIISFYYFLIQIPDPGNYLYEAVVGRKMSIKDFLHSKITNELDNLQTRILVGESSLTRPEFGSCSEADLHQALNNLQHQVLVTGLTERFDESLLLIKKHLGWKFIPVYTSKNVNRKRPARSRVSPEIVDLIRSYNQFDIKLYQEAEKMFEEALEKARITPAQIASFRIINRAYQYFLEASKLSRTTKVRAGTFARQLLKGR
jgi:hypothetical protein